LRSRKEVWASRFAAFGGLRRAIRSITFALRARWFRCYPSRFCGFAALLNMKYEI
jgi:hypothetical protein